MYLRILMLEKQTLMPSLLSIIDDHGCFWPPNIRTSVIHLDRTWRAWNLGIPDTISQLVEVVLTRDESNLWFTYVYYILRIYQIILCLFYSWILVLLRSNFTWNWASDKMLLSANSRTYNTTRQNYGIIFLIVLVLNFPLICINSKLML